MPKTDLEIRGEGGGAQFGLKIRGLPGPLPWIPQCKCIMLDCSSFTIIVVERKAKLH